MSQIVLRALKILKALLLVKFKSIIINGRTIITPALPSPSKTIFIFVKIFDFSISLLLSKVAATALKKKITNSSDNYVIYV
jgi:hypothetical protein